MTKQSEKTPNPQGKGIIPVLRSLSELSDGIRLPDIKDDSPLRVVEDFLSSLLVLSCEFRFMPVKGTVYSIYSHRGKLLLSLVSPREGGSRIYEEFLGECVLREDLSWSLSLHSSARGRFTPESVFKENGERAWRSQPDDKIHEMLVSTIRDKKIGRWSHKLGYYQDVLSYVLGKTVTLRSGRLLEVSSSLAEKVYRLDSEFSRSEGKRQGDGK